MCNSLHFSEFARSVQFFQGTKEMTATNRLPKCGCTNPRRSTLLRCAAFVLLAFTSSRVVLAESCLTASDLDNATRTALTAAALGYFDLVAKGDTGLLRQRAMPAVAAGFSVIESTVKENQAALA